MRALTAIPFLGLLVLVYSIVAISKMLAGLPENSMLEFLSGEVITVDFLPSVSVSTPWSVTWGDLFVIVGVVFLAIEIVRATRTDRISMANHALSMLVFVAGLIEFLLLKGFGTSTFFIVWMMTMVDVLVGMFVSIITARRDFGVAPGLTN